MRYGLIGEKLSHSFSKEIHEQLAHYSYELCEIAPDELSSFLEKREFSAINVTMPYKKAVIEHLDCISDEALALQAVNTVINRGGKLYGYNTDYLGMRDMIIKNGVSLSGKKVLILGTGGTSRTSALVAQNLGAREVLLVSREKKAGAIDYAEAYSLHSDTQVIINATPVGMYPDSYSSPIDISGFGSLEAVFDAVYNPLRTSLVLDAKEKGLCAEAGLYMLVSQAVHAIEHFIDAEFEDNVVDTSFDKISKQKENIVLIGMPSCGKTTVGELLAKDLKREIFDLDTEVEKRIGCTIAEYFKTHSEKEFRDIESFVTAEISKKNGVIISTGGGCILRSENVRALRSNGRLYFIDRSLKNLIPTDSRPLASKISDIERLYGTRYSIYTSVCDARIDGDLTPTEESNLIREEFYSKR